MTIIDLLSPSRPDTISKHGSDNNINDGDDGDDGDDVERSIQGPYPVILTRGPI